MRERSPTQNLPRWRRRLRKAGLAVASIVLLYVLAGLVLDVLIWLEIRRIRHEGDPVSVAQLAGPMPRDAENGALMYQEAFRLIMGARKFAALNELSFGQEGGTKPDLWARARAELPRFVPVVKIAQEAASMPRCRFRTDDWEGGYWPSNSKIDKLAHLLQGYALALAHNGNADEAMRALRLAVAVMDSVRDDHLYGSLMMRAGTRSRCGNIAIGIASSRTVSEKEAKALSDVLAWDDPENEIALMLKWERVTQSAMFDRIARESSAKCLYDSLGLEAPPWDRFVSSLLARPLLRGDQLFLLRTMRRMVRDAAIPFRKLPKPRPSGRPCEHWDESLWLSQRELMVHQYEWRRSCDGIKARVNGARVAIAVCSYRKRFGTYPRSLADLHKLGWKLDMDDPFSGREFVYARRAKGFLLYSIGSDLKDNGGRTDPQYRWPGEGYDVVWAAPR